MEIKSPWSAKAEKDDTTGQPVVGSDPRTEPGYYHEQFVESSFTARYSRWDDDKAWSSQEWKADKSMDDRTGQPVVTSCGKTHVSQSSFSHDKTQHVMLEEEKPHDRTEQPFCDPSKRNKATAIHHWKRRNRIRIVIGIQIILEQGE